MARTFTTTVQLQNYLESACEKAIKNASERLLKELQKCIMDEYYNLYEPLYYKPRTMKFFESAVAKILEKSSASIGIDELYMTYKYPAKYGNPDGTSGYWTGEDQIYMADAGFHGNVNIYRDGHFWKNFEIYCENNAITILKEELRKQGLNVK